MSDEREPETSFVSGSFLTSVPKECVTSVSSNALSMQRVNRSVDFSPRDQLLANLQISKPG